MKVSKIKMVKSKVEEELEITGVTLLSIEEAEEYLTDEDRKYDYGWWLRTPGYSTTNATDVGYDGSLHYRGTYVTFSFDCVRPALQIKNLESSNLEIGDIFELSGYEFKIISESLAWMHKQDIGCYAFNDDCGNGNNYETSDVKRLVDAWFERLVETWFEELKKEK